MAGLDRFTSGPDHYWSDQKYVEGDPRRPVSINLEADTGKRKLGEEAEAGEKETDKYAGIGIGLSGLLAENIVCHPFTILRRQCQVNVEARRYHTTPITLLPVLVNLNRWQGGSVLWKGIGSSLTIKGLSLGVEDCLSKVTPWPKEVDSSTSLKMLGQHLMLKCVSTAIITPFYSASLVETVQSEIASEKPGILDVFRDGVARLVSWSDPRCGRMLPVWVLVPPQVIHSVSHYTISTLVQAAWLQVLKATHREYQRLTGAVSRDPQLGNLPGLSQYQAQAAALTGHLVADTLLFPLETVLHRLHLQGTRSIIDNLDSGIEVTPILTRYEGVADCFSTILQEEGFSGLFKGFGAVMLQYAVHFLIIKFSSKLISQVAQLFSDNPNFLASDPRLSTVGDHQMSAPAPHDGMGSSTDLRSSPRMTKSSLTDSPSTRRRQQAGPVMPDMAPRSFSRETRDNTLLSSSGLSHEYSLGGASKRSLNEVKESSESAEMDSRFEPLFNPRPPGSSGLPSLLSFSTTSPTRRTLHDDEMSLFKK